MNAFRESIVKAFFDMTPRPCDWDVVENKALREQIALQIMNYPSFALPDLRSPVVICGFCHVFGVCTAWMVTGVGFSPAARRILQMQRQLCATMYDVLPVHRMDIEVMADRADANRWAKGLGFEFEYRQTRGGPQGQDVNVYLWPELKTGKG